MCQYERLKAAQIKISEEFFTHSYKVNKTVLLELYYFMCINISEVNENYFYTRLGIYVYIFLNAKKNNKEKKHQTN